MSSDAVPGVISPFFSTSPPSAPPSSKEEPTPQPTFAPKKKQHHDLINRGSKKSNPLATTLFVGLRALDPFWQYAILSSTSVVPRLLSTLNLTPTPLGTPLSASINYHVYPSFISALGLSPSRTLILTLSIGSAAKQIFWLLATCTDEFPTSAAIVVAIFNTLNNSLNTLLYCTALTSSAFYPTEYSYGYNIPQILGTTLFFSGLLLEAASEVQRAVFKSKPENKGKLCTTGFWGMARHINYGGYTIWRAAYGMACSGFVWAGVLAGFFGWNFATEAIEVLDDYCGGKYGEQWEGYKRDVPWKLVPGIY